MICPKCQEVLKDNARFCSNCGLRFSAFDAGAGELSVTEAEPDPLVGKVLDGKYEVLERLGEGGMGAVYRAHRVHIGDEVALKVLLRQFSAGRGFVERLRREARAAALHHRNVVAIYDFGEGHDADAPAYIVMELAEGEVLRQLLRRERRLKPARAVALMREICAGVGAAHRRQILHRDLKPENVIVLPPDEDHERETVKVVDFGIAKLRDAASTPTLTETGAVMGTPYYMSPEQCRGERLDARSDVYSLGAMLYEMLAGRPPFAAPSKAVVYAKHITEPPPPLPPDADTPPALAAVIERCLSKDPDARPADATALSRELLAAEESAHRQSEAQAQSQREEEQLRRQAAQAAEAARLRRQSEDAERRTREAESRRAAARAPAPIKNVPRAAGSKGEPPGNARPPQAPLWLGVLTRVFAFTGRAGEKRAERQKRKAEEVERKREEAEEVGRSRAATQSSTASVAVPTKPQRMLDSVADSNTGRGWLKDGRLLWAVFALVFIIASSVFVMLPGVLSDSTTSNDNANTAHSVNTATPVPQPTPTTEASITPSPTSTASPSPTPDDAALQERVNQAFTDDSQISAANISAVVLHGRVRLVGTITSEALKRYAERVTYSIKGVVGVNNEIVVLARIPTPTPRQAPSSQEPRLEEPTDADMHSGTVTLDIDPTTGLIAAPTCPVIRAQTFRIGNEPRKRCGPQYHSGSNTNSTQNTNSQLLGTVTLDIDPTTGLIAAPTCPVIRTKTFRVGDEPRRRCGPQYHQNQTTIPSETRPRRSVP